MTALAIALLCGLAGTCRSTDIHDYKLECKSGACPDAAIGDGTALLQVPLHRHAQPPGSPGSPDYAPSVYKVLGSNTDQCLQGDGYTSVEDANDCRAAAAQLSFEYGYEVTEPTMPGGCFYKARDVASTNPYTEEVFYNTHAGVSATSSAGGQLICRKACDDLTLEERNADEATCTACPVYSYDAESSQCNTCESGWSYNDRRRREETGFDRRRRTFDRPCPYTLHAEDPDADYGCCETAESDTDDDGEAESDADDGEAESDARRRRRRRRRRKLNWNKISEDLDAVVANAAEAAWESAEEMADQ